VVKDTSNKPLEWTGHPLFSAAPPSVHCLPLRDSVSRISGEGAGLGGMNGCALTWVLATVASAGR